MMVRSQHLWCLLYAIVMGHGGGGLSVMCAILGCTAQLCLLAAVMCGSPAQVHRVFDHPVQPDWCFGQKLVNTGELVSWYRWLHDKTVLCQCLWFSVFCGCILVSKHSVWHTHTHTHTQTGKKNSLRTNSNVKNSVFWKTKWLVMRPEYSCQIR